MSSNRSHACWVCGGTQSTRVKVGEVEHISDPSQVQITDADYGRTASIWKCGACGFLQCPDVGDVLSAYEQMDDATYEETRDERALQLRALLKTLRAHCSQGRMLDVGAGTGILVEEALKLGFDAVGVEPSRPLQARAEQRGTPVHLGVLPHEACGGPYDVVTLIDVIEHVPNPVEILEQVSAVLAPDGICAIVTPDVGSVAARLMGWRWWHFRMAHIGYFTVDTLELALGRAGLRTLASSRPGWYFPVGYLVERTHRYLPRALRFRAPSVLDRWVIPLNLRDSLLVIVTPK